MWEEDGGYVGGEGRVERRVEGMWKGRVGR